MLEFPEITEDFLLNGIKEELKTIRPSEKRVLEELGEPRAIRLMMDALEETLSHFFQNPNLFIDSSVPTISFHETDSLGVLHHPDTVRFSDIPIEANKESILKFIHTLIQSSVRFSLASSNV